MKFEEMSAGEKIIFLVSFVVLWCTFTGAAVAFITWVGATILRWMGVI